MNYVTLYLVDDVELDVEPVPQPEVAHGLHRGVLREERLERVAGAGARAAPGRKRRRGRSDRVRRRDAGG